MKRKTYKKEFKLEAIRLVEGGRSIKDVSEDIGISAPTLRRWCKELESEGEDAFRGQGNRTALEEEIRRLRHENKQLREEREILKKASAYFAKNLR